MGGAMSPLLHRARSTYLPSLAIRMSLNLEAEVKVRVPRASDGPSRLYIASVTDVADGSQKVGDRAVPNGWLRCSLPWVAPDSQSGWGPPPGAMGGNGEGLWLPQRKNNPPRCVVVFAAGDMFYEWPFFLGVYWDSKNAAPFEGSLERFGLLIQEQSQSRANKVWSALVDLGEKFLEVVTGGKRKLRFDDKEEFLELSSANGYSFKMDDKGKISTWATEDVKIDQEQGHILAKSSKVDLGDTGGPGVARCGDTIETKVKTLTMKDFNLKDGRGQTVTGTITIPVLDGEIVECSSTVMAID